MSNLNDHMTEQNAITAAAEQEAQASRRTRGPDQVELSGDDAARIRKATQKNEVFEVPRPGECWPRDERGVLKKLCNGIYDVDAARFGKRIIKKHASQFHSDRDKQQTASDAFVCILHYLAKLDMDGPLHMQCSMDEFLAWQRKEQEKNPE